MIMKWYIIVYSVSGSSESGGGIKMERFGSIDEMLNFIEALRKVPDPEYPEEPINVILLAGRLSEEYYDFEFKKT